MPYGAMLWPEGLISGVLAFMFLPVTFTPHDNIE
jgi:hypothetical protein